MIGPKGIMPMRFLALEKIKLQENVQNLETVNEDLAAILNNLSANPDTISMHAHELGYISEGERLIRLAGYSVKRQSAPASGTVIDYEKPDYLPEWISKLAGILLTVGIYSARLFRKRSFNYASIPRFQSKGLSRAL